jgi:hypothetical protein
MRRISWVLFLGIAACNNAGPMMMVDETARCMMLCARVNTACMSSTDCTPFCDPRGVAYTACDPQIDPFLDCVEAQPSTAACPATGACVSQTNALDVCITAHPSDAGAMSDAGTSDAGH